MMSLFAYFGLPGTLLLAVITVATLYGAVGFFRPHATWFTDLAKVRARLEQRRNRRPIRIKIPLELPGDVWPVVVGGPRLFRWPLNSTRYVAARIWAIVRYWPGIVGLVARAAWYPAAGLGFLTAVCQAVVLMTLVSLPVGVLLFMLDTVNVARGGTPPPRRFNPHTARASEDRTHHQHNERLARLRAEITTTGREAA